jgi:hypothetical protein
MTGITITVIPIGQNILHSTILPFLTGLSLLVVFFFGKLLEENIISKKQFIRRLQGRNNKKN